MSKRVQFTVVVALVGASLGGRLAFTTPDAREATRAMQTETSSRPAREGAPSRSERVKSTAPKQQTVLDRNEAAHQVLRLAKDAARADSSRDFAHPNEFTQRWQSESYDEDWSGETEDYVRGVVKDLGVRADVQEVACHTTLCRITLQLPSMQDVQTLSNEGRVAEEERWLDLDVQAGAVKVDLLIEPSRGG